MCTVSWLQQANGYQLFCNRDEKRTRAVALPPRVVVQDGVRCIAPIDGDFGGTWIGVNQFGVSMCLLNGANVSGREAPRQARLSRGHFLLSVLGGKSAAVARRRFDQADLEPFAPFTLLVLQAGEFVTILEWTGTAKLILPYGDSCNPLVSSSVDSTEVQRARRIAFAWKSSLMDFHADHGDGASAYTPCMHRPDAETVSFSRIDVDASEARFYYSPASPCRNVTGDVVTLPLTV